MQTIQGPLKAAFIAAIIVGFSTYLAENNDIKLAGIVASLPIAIPVTLFLHEKGAFQDWTYAFLFGIFIYFITALTLHFCYKNGYSKRKSIIFVMILWLLLVIFGWKYVLH